jgi:7-cyano-7-deazaguanine synthase
LATRLAQPTGLSSPNAVVLLSGGLDSATALAIARSRGFACHTLSFDYGQRHRHELVAAERISKELGASTHRTVGIDLRGVGGSALTADIPVPKDRTRSEMTGDIPVTYVPARNLVFLSIATAIAEVLGASDLFLGVNSVDYSGYPDCRPEFIEAFARAATLGTRAGVQGRAVVVHAPLVRMTKAEIIKHGLSLGIDYGMTHSCYDPLADASGDIRACGRCDSCQLRRDGFRDAGVTDPTRYATN